MVVMPVVISVMAECQIQKKCKAYAQTAYTRIEEEKRDLK